MPQQDELVHLKTYEHLGTFTDIIPVIKYMLASATFEPMFAPKLVPSLIMWWKTYCWLLINAFVYTKKKYDMFIVTIIGRGLLMSILTLFLW